MKAVNILTGEQVEVSFFTQWQTPVELQQEKGDPHTITEMAYVPPKVQIEDMIRAGQALDAYRRGRFGAADGGPLDQEDEIEVNLLNQPGLDLTDVQKVAEQLSARLTKQEKEAAKAAGEAAKAADEKRIQEAAEKLLAARQAKAAGIPGEAAP